MVSVPEGGGSNFASENSLVVVVFMLCRVWCFLRVVQFPCTNLESLCSFGVCGKL